MKALEEYCHVVSSTGIVVHRHRRHKGSAAAVTCPSSHDFLQQEAGKKVEIGLAFVQ